MTCPVGNSRLAWSGDSVCNSHSASNSHSTGNSQPPPPALQGETTILLIEPDTDMRERVSISLEQVGYRVMQGTDGHRVLDWLTSGSHNIRLLILEAALPQITGLELCQRLRAQGHDLPILMISDQASEADRVLGLETGADDYLVKPFGLSELVARSRVLLRYWSCSGGQALQYRDLIRESITYTVTFCGRPISLSPKEFRLLELLMRYPKRVWQREQLLDCIWGSDYAGDFRTVDTHIRWLRKKIEQNPGKPDYIKTVRGFGYRLG